MKVAFLTFDCPGFIGGPPTWFITLLPELKTHGIEICALFFIAGNPQECTSLQILQLHGIRCLYFSYSEYTENQVLWLLQTLSIELPDIFVVCLGIPGLYACQWIKLAGIPTIAILHADNDYFYEIFQEFGSQSYLSKVICVSKFIENKILSEQCESKHSQLLEYLPYGIHIPDTSAKISNNKLRVVYVGRLAQEQKRILDTVNVLCKVSQINRNVEVIIYGDGPDKAIIEEMLEPYTYEYPIKLGGKLLPSEVYAILANSHIFILLSDYEGLPIALLEAMASGLVPIVYDVQSGVSQLIKDGINGFIVTDREESVVSAITKLSDNHILWQKMSTNARNQVIENYSINNITLRWIDLFNELIHQNSVLKQQKIKFPKLIRLPSPNAEFKKEDRRIPSFYRRLKVKLSKYFGVYINKVYNKFNA